MILAALVAPAPPLAAQLGPLQTLPAGAALERHGSSLANVGDLDLDGIADVAIGAPLSSQHAVEAGLVRVYSGVTGALRFTIYGASSLDHFGWAVSAAGDWNQDQVPDIAVGAPDADYMGPDSGAAYVYSGADASLIRVLPGLAGGGRLGTSLARSGDFNGDGVEDLLVGAPDASGTHAKQGWAGIFSGSDGQVVWSVAGAATGDRLGTAVAAGFDFNSDGVNDWLIGADQAGLSSGLVQLYSGVGAGVLLFQWEGAQPLSRFGASLAVVGNFDGAGAIDCAVGAPLDSSLAPSAGAAVVLDLGTKAQLAQWRGVQTGEQFGHAVAAAGDVDQDGLDDVAVGAPSVDVFGSTSGSVRVFRGGANTLLARHVGSGGGERFGSALVCAGDASGDSVPDLWIGAPKSDHSFPDGGSVHLMSGADSSPFVYCASKPSAQGCTPMIGWLGSPTLSGADDFFVTAGNVPNEQVGLAFHGPASQGTPFLGGKLCVAAPIEREALAFSGGNSGQPDCSGAFATHLSHAAMTGNAWSLGQHVYAQYWLRDPLHPDGTGVGLSNALAFVVGP